jgi:hypothetical protein
MTCTTRCPRCGRIFHLFVRIPVEDRTTLPDHMHKGRPCPGAEAPFDVRALLAGSLLRQLAREGFAVRHEAGRLLVSPRDRLTPELTAWIRYLKAEVIAELDGRGVDMLP